MAAKQYPFIDVAVHERVRLPFARGDAVILFSLELDRVLWASGRGAALFGHRSIYDFLDARLSPADLALRQVKAAARQVGGPGDVRKLVMRVGSGFRSRAVTAEVERIILVPGEEAVLFSAPVADGGDLAAELLSGFDDPDTHMAVLDGEGAVLAASPAFGSLGISEPTRRFLVEMAGRNGDWLIKRPVPTGRGQLPAAIGRISAAPPLHLLFAVETVLGHLDETGEAAPSKQTPGEHAISGEPLQDPLPPESETTDAGPAERKAETPLESGDPVDAAPAEAIGDAAEKAARSNHGADEAREAVEALAPPLDREAGAEAVGEAPRQTDESDGGAAFHFDRHGRPVRFVWKIDAEGRFSEVSEEFALAVGARSAAIVGETFQAVAARYDLDPDGRIGELLRRRDTWSGKTLLWPIEGTRLSAPVDLAALPTYSRDRAFDGFRGFGIVRLADAAEDPRAIGLTLTGSQGWGSDAEKPAGDAAVTAERSAGEPVDEFDDTALAGEERNTDDEPLSAEDAKTQETGEQPGGPLPAEDEFRGERPALRLVETPGRRQSDKIIHLEERRPSNRDGLSSGEQAAFREIARQLGESFGTRKAEDTPAANGPSEPAETPQANAAVESADQTGMTEASPAISPEARVDEMPGLEVGPHADDLPRAERGAIAPPRTRMDYGLTASVVDAIPVALLIHAGDRLIHANPEFTKLTGHASAEALAQAGGLDVLFDTPAAETTEGTVLLRHADDERLLSARARLQSVRWEDGSALMLALTPAETEVDDAVRAETSDIAETVGTANPEQNTIAALRIEADELRSILETATDGVVVVGQEGDIRSMNRSASALFNYDEEETRGKPFAMLFAHESQKAVLDYLSGLSGHGVASVLNDGREVIGRESAGGFIPLFMTMGRLSSSSSYCAVIRDITQWKRTEEELRNAKRAAETANAHKSDFLARVSHEIRTPLNAIIGFSDMMATERFGPIGHPRYIEYANDIGRSGRHVLDIVNDLLDISKIEAGEMDLEFTAVGLNDTVAEAVSLVQPQANSQRVIIRTSLSTAVPQVVADLRSVKQIALNILSNAIRFTPSGGQIVVSTAYEANGSVVLRIRDTGVGMTRSELDQAMKPFRQVTTGARKRGDGTGLGLPLTKAMVDANRASFAISSTPNEGTLVEITFPSPRVLAD